MQNNTIQAFFALVRAGLWEKDVELRKYGATDFEEIMRLAEEQSVVGLVTAGLEHVVDVKVPQECLLQFIGSTLQIEQQNKDMNAFIEQLIEKLRKADIYTLLLKGQGIAQCYEKPLWRASGDVDLFLSKDNYEKTKEFLLPLASTTEKEEAYKKHIGITINEWVVELHGYLRCGLSSRINRVLDKLQRDVFYNGNVRSWINGKTHVFMPGADDDIPYVFTHILNHFYKGGIGIRQICDWCRLLWTYRKTLNRKLLESRIEEMGLVTPWKAFAAFAVEYLGMPTEAMPFYEKSEKGDRKAHQISEFIMMTGNFGHNRDMGYYSKYPYLIRKVLSTGQRIGDLIRHARIFPLDSVRFAPYIMYRGIVSAVRGE